MLPFINIFPSPNICTFWDTDLFVQACPKFSTPSNLNFLTERTAEDWTVCERTEICAEYSEARMIVGVHEDMNWQQASNKVAGNKMREKCLLLCKTDHHKAPAGRGCQTLPQSKTDIITCCWWGGDTCSLQIRVIVCQGESLVLQVWSLQVKPATYFRPPHDEITKTQGHALLVSRMKPNPCVNPALIRIGWCVPAICHTGIVVVTSCQAV